MSGGLGARGSTIALVPEPVRIGFGFRVLPGLVRGRTTAKALARADCVPSVMQFAPRDTAGAPGMNSHQSMWQAPRGKVGFGA